MKTLVFSSKPSTIETFKEANRRHRHDLHFTEARLEEETALLAQDYPAICVFVNDIVTRPLLDHLKACGVKLIALRAAGFNNVDIDYAHKVGICLVRVPAYSPHGVAEHAVALIMTLNRKIHRAHNRVREGNFSLEGLMGFDMYGKTVGVIGTGKIGAIAAGILHGFGCSILVSDPFENPEVKKFASYVPVDELLARSDIVTLHCPLTPDSHHMINEASLKTMKRGAMLINTSRGGLVDAAACIEALKSGQLGLLGLDVYEEEADLFFEDLSGQVLQDDLFARLLTFPNVLITAHQAFFTKTALDNIAETTMANLTEFEETGACRNAINPEAVKGKSVRVPKR